MNRRQFLKGLIASIAFLTLPKEERESVIEKKHVVCQDTWFTNKPTSNQCKGYAGWSFKIGDNEGHHISLIYSNELDITAIAIYACALNQEQIICTAKEMSVL